MYNDTSLALGDTQGNVAEWLRRGLQILVSRFDSGRCLHTIKYK
jgi:hypothetical protein